MPKIQRLISRKPQKDYYVLIGDGALTFSDLSKGFNPQREFQIVHLEASSKVIIRTPFVYILLDGTDYRGTEYAKIHDYFNGDIPNLFNNASMLELNNQVPNIVTPHAYKTHNHNISVSGTKKVNTEITEVDPNLTNFAIPDFAGGDDRAIIINNFSDKIFSITLDSVNFQSRNYIVPSSTIVNYYCKLKID